MQSHAPPSTHRLAWVATAGLGIGAISRRKALGALGLVAGPVFAFVAVVLAAQDCAFY